jgi:arabinoxylan arabinofuranohydrolase
MNAKSWSRRLENSTAERAAAHALAAAVFAATTLQSVAALADNPIVQTNYTADPAPMVHEGRLYLYTSHDEDVTVDDFFTMNDWRLYSTLDMVNWTDHGSPAGYKTFSWGKDSAWAPHGIFRNGKFYLYVPLNNNSGSKIGVAVADQPAGPFKDPLGKGLIESGSGNIDPNAFIDADGQAYLYWGNPDLYYVKLNEDMISFQGSPTKVNLTTQGFGTRTKTDRATAYEEGPWFYKRGELYYLVYPADSTPEKLSYTTSSGPLGPWMYRGDIMAKETGTGASFTNHPGVIDYKGHSYLFYHNAALPGGGGYKRSVCVEEFTYGADGSIPTVTMSKDGPKAVENLNPFQRVEAETIAFSSGLKTEVSSAGGIDVTKIDNGDYIKVKNVNFASGATSVDVSVAASGSGGSLEFHLDSQSGTLIATCAVTGTGGAQMWTKVTCPVTGATSVHDVFIKMTGSGSNLFNFDWWQFAGPGSTEQPNGGGGTGGGGTGGAGGAGVAGATATGGTAGASAGVGGTTSATGGTTSASGGSSSTTGGNPASAGTAPSGTGGATLPGGGQGSGAAPTEESSGCGCRVPSSGAGAKGSLAVALLALVPVLRRRRRHSR